jgi:hypothetical protein
MARKKTNIILSLPASGHVLLGHSGFCGVSNISYSWNAASSSLWTVVLVTFLPISR